MNMAPFYPLARGPLKGVGFHYMAVSDENSNAPTDAKGLTAIQTEKNAARFIRPIRANARAGSARRHT